jgi:hypothetical protein
MNFVIPQTIGDDHTLWAGLMDIHLGNGNRYYGVCSQHAGSDQDFIVYRRRPGKEEFEFVAKLDGKGFDAVAFVTAGMGKIRPDGALEICASGQPVGVTDNSGTGFDGFGAIIPNVDDPWALQGLVKAAQTPAHIKLNPPKGYRPYGANQSFVVSAEVVDGLPVYFFAQEGWGYSTDNDGFGEYVFKQVGDRRAEYVYYNGLDVPDGRGDLYTPGNGRLYITGNESDSDKLPSIYEVPGYVPFGGTVYVGGGSTTGGGDTAALELKVAQLEQQLAGALDLARKAMERANYVKSIYEPVWVTLEELENRPVGISRDDAWVLGPQSVYADLMQPQSGIAGQVRDIARQLVGTAGGGIDQVARDIANEALKKATDIINNYLPNYIGEPRARIVAAQEAEKYTARLWAAWVAYTDKRLLNLIWDRGVKLARYLKVPGADKAPINDEANLKV